MDNKTTPPWRYIVAAIVQWAIVGSIYGVLAALTFPLGLLVAGTAKRTQSPLGEEPRAHDQRYIDQGSSGTWEYWASSLSWLKWWNNYEDGLLGEPSGKHSARVKGEERSFWNIYRWLIRNPFNYGKRTSRFFACFVDECHVQWWGTGDVTDKAPIVGGWHFVRAVHKESGKVYYGYRYVCANSETKGLRRSLAKLSIAISNLFADEKRTLDNSVYNAVFGFKLRPSHATAELEEDDRDKAFTARIQFASWPD